MNVVAGLTVNSLFWISAPRESEEGSSRRIVEDLSSLAERIGLPFQEYRPPTKALLLDALDKIEEAARAGVRPILHFDMHGSKESGLEIAPTGEFVAWPALVGKLQAINRATGNNLCIVSASCFGLHAIREVKITESVPFYLLVAPEHEVSIGFLEDNTVPFYSEVFSSLDIMAAHANHLASGMGMFHCERMLAIVMGRYIRSACKGRPARERRERLISEVFNAGREPTPENLKAARQLLKAGLRPSQDLVDRFAGTFLIGKPCSFSLDDLIEVVQAAEKPPAKQG